MLEFDGKILTPFGWQDKRKLPKIMAAADFALNSEGEWKLYSQSVNVEQERQDARGVTHVETKTFFIPVRFYNFQLNLIKTGNIDEAIRLTTDEYLPAKFNYTSYKNMFDDYSAKYGNVVDEKWEEEDAEAKKEAFDQYEDFRDKFAMVDKRKNR